jgi:hypothetical protein
MFRGQAHGLTFPRWQAPDCRLPPCHRRHASTRPHARCRARPRLQPGPGLADLLPGPVPDQQRRLHGGQRPGRPGPGPPGLDGDPAADRLCAGRRAVHRPGGAPPAALRPQARLPARAGGGDGVGGAVCVGGVGGAVLAADRRHGAGGLLQRQCGALPLCRRRAGRPRGARESHLVGAGRRHPRRGAGARAGAGDARQPARGALRRRLCRVGRGGAAVAARPVAHPLSGAAAAPGRAGRRAAGGRGAPAGLHRRHRRLGAGLRRDEPADGRHADRDAGLLAPLPGGRLGAGGACAGHVRAELLHRPADPPHRRAAGAGRRRGADGGVHRGGAARHRPDALHRRAAGARRGLEFPLRGRHHALHRVLPGQPPPGRPGADGLLGAGHDDRHLVQLGCAGHHRRLAGDEPGRAGAAGPAGGHAGLAARLAAPPPGAAARPDISAAACRAADRPCRRGPWPGRP